MASDFIIIAIDGGAGSGKSTTARMISQRLNYMHVDTGSHYRLLTHWFLKGKISPEELLNEETLTRLQLDSVLTGTSCRMRINKEDVIDSELRTEQINEMVSIYSALSSVRKHLFNYQRSLVKFGQFNKFQGIIMEGRDIGSVILPDADLKLFLFASEEIRNQRREAQGLIDSIKKRDRLDSERKNSPLIATSNSIHIDTGSISIEEVYLLIIEHIKKL